MNLFVLWAEVIINTGGQLSEYPAALKLSMGAGNQSETERQRQSFPASPRLETTQCDLCEFTSGD